MKSIRFLFLVSLWSVSSSLLTQESTRKRKRYLSLTDQLDAQSGQAICRIPTREIISTAQATASRILQGVCNPRELNERFTSLESQIIDQFNVLKTMVLNVEDKLRDQDEKVKSQHRKIQKALGGRRHHGGGTGKDRDPTFPYRAYEDPDNNFFDGDFIDNGMSNKNRKIGVDYDYYDEHQVGGSFDISGEVEERPSPRLEEMTKHNSTIHQEDGKRVFTYYWKVKDMVYRMKNWGWERSIKSNSFYIFKYGYMMYMRMYPNQEGKNVFVHVGLTKGEYDSALDWPFTLKLKIQVLDHSIEAQDIASRVWDPRELCSEWNWKRPVSRNNYECVGLGFPQTTLRYRDYLHDEALVVKLTVYLD